MSKNVKFCIQMEDGTMKVLIHGCSVRTGACQAGL